MPQMRDLKTEVFKVVYLNSNNRIIDIADAAACNVMGIRMLDHIIIGDGNYFSFTDEGVMG